VDEVPLGEVIFLVLLFSPVVIIPPILLNNHLHLSIARTKEKKLQAGGDLHKVFPPSAYVNGGHWIEKYFHLANFRGTSYAGPRTSRCTMH